MQQLNLTIENMTCIHCAQRVESALRRVKGVAKAHVNLTGKTAAVEYDPEQTNVRAIAQAVREEGYTPGVNKTRMRVRGMRCASCVTQVEQALQKTPGVVTASVNAATAEADITYRPALIDSDGLSRAVESSGYRLAPTGPLAGEEADAQHNEQLVEYRRLMRKFRFAAIVSVPVLLLSYPDLIPGLRDWMPMGSAMRRWVWGLLGLVTLPVMLWSGSQFYSGMWAGLKHRSANMHTLIATGITAAYVYSAVAVAVPGWFPEQALAEVFWDVVTVVAMGLLYPFTGLLLSPLIAAAAMAFSSVTVVTNANRLRYFQPKGGVA